MEKYRPHVIEMAVQREQAPSSLIRPDLNLVIVSARYKKRLRFVEINPSDRAIVLFETVDQGAHAVIP